MLQQAIREGITSLPVLLFGGMNRCFCNTKRERLSRLLRLQGLPVTNRDREMPPCRPIAGLEPQIFCFILSTGGSHAILDESSDDLDGTFQQTGEFFC